MANKVVPVHQLAFHNGDAVKIRRVTIPEESGRSILEQLEDIFHFGQNDFQPQQLYSVSVGDVIELDGQYYLVAMVGFYKMTAEQFILYRDEIFATMKTGKPMSFRYDWASKHNLELVS